MARFELWAEPSKNLNEAFEGLLPFFAQRANFDERFLSSYLALLAQGQISPHTKVAKRRGEFTGDIGAVMPDGFEAGYCPRSRFLSATEAQVLLAELTPDRAARVAFILATGARWGESERARPGDVDLTRGTVLLRGTKTLEAARVVPIVAWGKPLIEHTESFAEGEDGALFRPWGSVRRDLAEACKRAKLSPVSPNDLRRTYGTWLRLGGVEPHLIGVAMGHRDSRMVERVYGRMPHESLGMTLRQRLGDCSAYVARARRTESSERLQRHREPSELATLSAQSRNRTSDTRIFSPLLYQLSYLGGGKAS